MKTIHQNQFNVLLGRRIKIAREEHGWTQGELAMKFGAGSAQIISNIESGSRRVSADDLFKLAKILARPSDFFTDPYILAEKKVVSFRAVKGAKGLKEFETKVNNLVSAAIRFADLSGDELNPLRLSLPVKKETGLPFVAKQASRISMMHDLGSQPSQKLQEFIEEKCKILVLYIDAPPGISGAACHHERIDVIVINRKEPSFRQNFDLAHEFFHILTWESLPPETYDWEDHNKSKVEKLADSFASGLLLPTESVCAKWEALDKNMSLPASIMAIARDFNVSGQAMFWRLVNLDLLKKPDQDAVIPKLSRSDDLLAEKPLLGETFVRRMHKVLDQGLVSASKAAKLVDLEIDELPDLFADYGLKNPLY